jgi:BirA family transcriptional regulator, biotin operon repressor / biotin---[acetyl-CoA-carboxylase] ligase
VASGVGSGSGSNGDGSPHGRGHEGQPWAVAAAAAPVVAALAATRLIARLELRDRVTSTQDEALALAAAGAGSGTVVLAETQTAGRGRGGRHWDDEPGPGRSLALTVLLDVPEHGASLVPHATGLALRDAVSEVITLTESARSTTLRVERPRPPGLKWPNDLIVRVPRAEVPGHSWQVPSLDGTVLRKLAGVLVERDRVAGREVLLVGVGLNVDLRGVVAPDARGSLAELVDGDVEPPRLRTWLLATLLRALDGRLAPSVLAHPGLLDDYRSACDTLGRAVRVERPGLPALLGTAVAVDDAGRLVVVSADGHPTTVVAGTVRDVDRTV